MAMLISSCEGNEINMGCLRLLKGKALKANRFLTSILDHLSMVTEFRLKETREKMVDILRKTWVRKMGEKGRAAALKLPLGHEELSLVKEALGA
eukprot:1155039-Pelagomonas_calceolata.AAC.4